jgi:hypothetical protein
LAPSAARAQLGETEMSSPPQPAPPSPAAPQPPTSPPFDNPARPAPPTVEAPVGPPPSPRPRMTLALGMGVAFESAGLSRTETVPAFFGTGGVGADWPVGVELAAFASSATGRFKAPDAPVDRLALSLIGVVRPLAWAIAADDARYRARLLRAIGVEVGPGIERDATAMRSGSRFGVHTGARLEVPIVPAGSPSELRIRLGLRYMYGLYTPQVGTTVVGDGLELYAALVTIF